MPAVETLKMSSGRGPDVGNSPSNHQGEGLVPVIETLETVRARTRCRRFLRQGEGPAPAIETLEMSRRGPDVGDSPSSHQGEGPREHNELFQ